MVKDRLDSEEHFCEVFWIKLVKNCVGFTGIRGSWQILMRNCRLCTIFEWDDIFKWYSFIFHVISNLVLCSSVKLKCQKWPSDRKQNLSGHKKVLFWWFSSKGIDFRGLNQLDLLYDPIFNHKQPEDRDQIMQIAKKNDLSKRLFDLERRSQS